jgi:hypothetical protein
MFATKVDRRTWAISTVVIIVLIVIGLVLFNEIVIFLAAGACILFTPFIPTLIFYRYHQGNKKFIVQLEIEKRIEGYYEELKEIADDICGKDTSREFIEELADNIVDTADGLLELKNSLDDWDAFYEQIKKDRQHYTEQYDKSKAAYEKKVRQRNIDKK